MNNNKDSDTINEISSQIKKIINNNKFDYTYFYLSRLLKFIINFILVYLFIYYLFNNFDNLTKNKMILIICTYVSILLYLLDCNFPTCYIKL